MIEYFKWLEFECSFLSCVAVYVVMWDRRHNVNKNGTALKTDFTWFDPNELEDVNGLDTRAGIAQVTSTNSNTVSFGQRKTQLIFEIGEWGDVISISVPLASFCLFWAPEWKSASQLAQDLAWWLKPNAFNNGTG